MAEAGQRSYTLDDYGSVERSSPLRHEFVHGAIYAMAGGTARHNEVAANVQYALRRALDGTPCRPVGADQRLRVTEDEYTYADVTVFCGRIEVAPGSPPDTATNPVLVVEVLSPSTQAYDRGAKLAMYQRMPSVGAVWLVEPEAPQVTVWRRGDVDWVPSEVRGLEACIEVRGGSVALADIYDTRLS